MCTLRSVTIQFWRWVVLLSVLVLASFWRSKSASAEVPRRASQRWYRLLQYEPRWFGGVKSRVDDPRFFFSPNGKIDPEAELAATIAAFTTDAASQCAFPARARFVREELGEKLPAANCPEFAAWQRGLNASKAVLVFSTSYAGNAASMFGHTFLRLDPSGSTPALLSYGVGFAAVSKADDGTVTYALRGLFGGYPGVYSIAPYYMTVNEYNNQEARDLWEYELDFSPSDLVRLTEVLWELYGKAYLDYYFLDENCSFQLAALLEAVKPEWDLTTGLGPIVLPRDIIQRLQRYPKALGAVSYRSSLRKKWLSRYEMLSSSQKDQLRSLPDQVATAPAPVLAAYIAKLDFMRQRARAEFNAEQKQQLFAALGAISRQDLQSDKPAAIPQGSNRPDKGHAPRMVSVSAKGSFGLRAGYHDLLDQSEGYEPHFGIRYLDLNLGSRKEAEKSRIEVEKATIFDIISLDPYEPADPRLSWHGRLGYEKQISRRCGPGHALVAGGGAGYAKELWQGGIVYGMADIAAQWREDCDNHAALGPGLRFGILVDGPSAWRHHLVYQVSSDMSRRRMETLQSQLETGHSLAVTIDWSLVAKGRLVSPGSDLRKARAEWDIELQHYF